MPLIEYNYMIIHIGCCSKTVAWAKYAELFDTIEVNSTFYKLPNISTAKRWVKDTRGKVIFCIKAFQGITHTIDSPTWKRAGSQRPKDNVNNYGHLKPTKENFDCWKNILEVCNAITARVCVIQLPPSFAYTPTNLKNMQEFFANIDRDNLLLGIEFRHASWFNESIRDEVRRLLKDTGLVHIVDPFVFKPVYSEALLYFRLHGLCNDKDGALTYDYNYTYFDDELVRLKEILDRFYADEAFIMFNNINMHEDALRLKYILDL